MCESVICCTNRLWYMYSVISRRKLELHWETEEAP